MSSSSPSVSFEHGCPLEGLAKVFQPWHSTPSSPLEGLAKVSLNSWWAKKQRCKGTPQNPEKKPRMDTVTVEKRLNVLELGLAEVQESVAHLMAEVEGITSGSVLSHLYSNN